MGPKKQREATAHKKVFEASEDPHKRLLEGENIKTLDPEQRLRKPDDKRGLKHPDNPIKFRAPTPEEDAARKLEKQLAKKKKDVYKPPTEMENLLKEGVTEKRPPQIYRLKKEKTAAQFEASGKDPSKWQTTLQGGLNFSMYPSHNPTQEVSPSRPFFVGNKDNNGLYAAEGGSGSPSGWTKGISTSSFHHYESSASAYTEKLDGTIVRDMNYKTADQALAASRHNVQKLNTELSRGIARVYNKYMGLCDRMSNEANRKSIEVYKRLLYKIRWCNPPVPMAQQGLINDYILHLLAMPDAYGRRAKFKGEGVMRQGFHKHVAQFGEKDYTEILALINRIRSIVLHNDGQVSILKASLTTKQSKMTINKSSTLRWKMETNVGRRDRFWTSWFFAMRGMPAELHRHLSARKKESLRLHLEKFGGGLAGEEGWKQKLARDDAWKRGDTLNDCDERDPDFGLTALHYASKQSNVDVIKILLAHGANPNIRAPDGRTALHFAAAYSTREICLELLGAEADVDAIDEYGCRAIDLAEQNENRATYVTCEKWKHLVPPPLISTIPHFFPSGSFTNISGEDSISTFQGGDTSLSQDGSLENSFADHKMGQFDVSTFLAIPDEYKPMDEARISKMSRPLRAIAYRLKVPSWVLQQLPDGGVPQGLAGVGANVEEDDEAMAGEGAFSPFKGAVTSMRLSSNAVEDLDPMAELRLCAKVAEGCFNEGFVPEALQALRRRWKLARQLLAANSEQAESGDRELEYSVGTATEFAPGIGGGGLEGRTSVSTVRHSNSVSHAASAVLQKHGFGGKLTPSSFSLHACVEMGTQLAEALIRHGQEGFAATILAETFLLSSNAPTYRGGNRTDSKRSEAGKNTTFPNPFGSSIPIQHRSIEKYAGLWNNNDVHSASTDSVYQASINNSAGADDCVTAHSLSITGKYLEREQEMKKMNTTRTLGNTVSWGGDAPSSHNHMEPSVAVALLARRCEVLLCVWDTLLIDKKETERTSPFPMPAILPPSMLPKSLAMPQSKYANTASIAGGVDQILLSEPHENNTGFNNFEFGNSQAAERAERMGETLHVDGSNTKSALATGYYDGKGEKNTTRDPAAFSSAKSTKKIDGSNYKTVGNEANASAGPISSNQQVYNYSSTYKDYVGKYLDHQSQYIMELRKDLTEETEVEYEQPEVESTLEPTDNTALSSSLATGDQDYNHHILVDNLGRPLADQSLDNLATTEDSHTELPHSQSVTFGASVAFDDGEVSAIKEAEDSSAWYDQEFKISPSKAYMDRMMAQQQQPQLSTPRSLTPTNASESTSQRMRPKTMTDVQAQESFISYGYQGEDYQLYQRILGVASETRICIENAINIALQTTSHLLVEPVVLAPLLEILAECYERENNYEDSLACLVRAETITRRTLGTDTLEAITIMTNVLRMLIKCETKAGQVEAVLKAQELTRTVDRYRASIESDHQKDINRRKRDKDLGVNFIITDDGAIVLNPDRPTLKAQRQEKDRRAQMGLEEDSVLSLDTAAEDFDKTQEEAKGLFIAAIELISLSKLLECGYEKMDTFDTDTEQEKFLKEREKPSHYTVSVTPGGAIRPNPKNKKVKGASMSKIESVAQAQSKTDNVRKKYVVTGRMKPLEDKSETLGIATGLEVKGFGDSDVDPEVDPELDGGLSQVFNSRGKLIQNRTKKTNLEKFSTHSASLAPHEHIVKVKSDIAKQKKKVLQDDGSFVLVAPKAGRKGQSLYDATDNTKNDIASQLAATSINAGRYLQHKRYLKVNAVPLLEKRRVFQTIEVPKVAETELDDVTSKYYRQLQHRALVLDFKHAKPQLVRNDTDSLQRSQSGSNSKNQSINNSINNSLLIQRNADGTQRMASAGLGDSRPTASDVVYDGSIHSKNSQTYNPVDIRITSEFPDGPGSQEIRPRVFEKTRTVGPNRSIDVISNLEVLLSDELTAVQVEQSIGTFDNVRYKDALREEQDIFKEQEWRRQQRNEFEESNTVVDESLNGEKRIPAPWVLPRSPGSPKGTHRSLSKSSGSYGFDSIEETDPDKRFSNAHVSSQLSIQSPYFAKAVDLGLSATVAYDNKYGVAAEGRREQEKEAAAEREKKHLQQIENKAIIDAAEQETRMAKQLEVRIHPLAGTHLANKESIADPIRLLQEQERSMMRSAAGIKSVLLSHPGLAGLLPTAGIGIGANTGMQSSRTNITTTSAVDASSKKAAMLATWPNNSNTPLIGSSLLASTSSTYPDDVAVALGTDAAKYVGSIMTTGRSLVSIPHVHRALDIDGDVRVPDLLEAVALADDNHPKSRFTNKQLKENKSMLRFRKGEWQYQTHQSEDDVSSELMNTDTRNIQQSLEAIAEEKARQEPVKWHV